MSKNIYDGGFYAAATKLEQSIKKKLAAEKKLHQYERDISNGVRYHDDAKHRQLKLNVKWATENLVVVEKAVQVHLQLASLGRR